MFWLRLLLAFAVLWLMLSFLLLIHEWGHVWAMDKLKMRPDKVVIGVGPKVRFSYGGLQHELALVPLIGYVKSTDYEKANLRDRALVAAAGPFASLVGAGALFGMAMMMPSTMAMLMVKGSLVLAVCNLVPFPPLDGGIMFEHALSKFGILLSQRQKKQMFYAGVVMIALITYLVS